MTTSDAERKPRVLFLTHYFPPEVNAPANRTYEHAKEWRDRAEVTVVTNVPNHPEGKTFPGYRNRLLQEETIDGVRVVRVLTFVTPNEGFLLRTFNYVFYMIMATLYVVFSRVKFDVLVATSPQFFCGLAGKYAAKLRRKPFVLEIRDLWPESIVHVGAITNKRIVRLLEGMERRLYKAADRIVVVTRSFKEKIAAGGIDEAKIRIFYNGVYPDSFATGAEISDEELRAWISGGFTAGYIGTIGMAHSVSTLVEAAARAEDPEIRYVVVGGGADRANVEREIEERGLDNIRVFPIQPKKEIPAIIKALDAFVVHLKNVPLFLTVVPSKMFEGMIMRKPILMGVKGESREILDRAECAVNFEPENAEELARAVAALKADPERRRRLGENGERFVRENFDRRKIAAELLDVILETKRR
jgi:glycosyltransferase involved in cell wall biosynthesis